MEVLGVIGRDQTLEIPERHLGLIPANEAKSADAAIERLADAVSDGVNVDRLIEIADTGKIPVTETQSIIKLTKVDPDVRIAIARDAAFGFYYQDDIEAFADAGAELVPFDTLCDPKLPEADGLFIGGGFPENHLAALSANQNLLTDILQALAAGMPAYAECGGLMYLARSIKWQNEKRDMVGAVPGDIIIDDRPQGRGYVVIKETGTGLWPPASPGQPTSDASSPAHEFHYARLESLPGGLDYAYRVIRGYGIDGQHDGLLIGNLQAGFVHHRNTEADPWIRRFVKFVRATSKLR
jgi:cobyrinic acid a,c-diamide synthase